jgi:RNA polymerase sigma-70 factor (ECF subfamily)
MSSSLLNRLRDQDADAWRRLVELYYPLVRDWCLRARLQAEDAADVAQEVFRALAGNVMRFEREGGKNSFRGWLWGITHNQLIAHWRRRQRQPTGVGGTEAQRRIAAVAEPQFEEPSTAEAADDKQGLLRRAVELLRSEVSAPTWQAFWRTTVEGQAPAAVAADLGLTVNAVYLAKARLLRRLREEFGELIE